MTFGLMPHAVLTSEMTSLARTLLPPGIAAQYLSAAFATTVERKSLRHAGPDVARQAGTLPLRKFWMSPHSSSRKRRTPHR